MNKNIASAYNSKVLVLLLSSVPLLIHLYTNAFAGYGYFRDELYYLACSNRLDLGYVDQPPLSSSESKELSELPQFYADMFGWEEMAANVSKVYSSLPEEERKRTIVFGQNYGEAGSIDFFKKKYPLPEVVSGHNSYWVWGYKNIADPTVILIGGDKEDHLKIFENVEEAMRHTVKYSMPYENNIPIYIARQPKISLSDAWEEVKHFD